MAHTHSVYDSDTHFTINPITRALRNTASSKTNVIQYDHNSERFTFEIPRIIENHDMSLCNSVQVHYINIDAVTKAQIKGAYEVDDMQISPNGDDVVICSWLISNNATQLVGPLDFLVRFACVSDNGTVDYVWNTAIYTGIGVSSGIDNGNIIAEEYPDILAQWKAELEQSKIVDPTLTKAGAGADAKVTGDRFAALHEDFVIADNVNGTHIVGGTEVLSRPIVGFYGDDGDQPVCLTNIASPVKGMDVANKHYVDGAILALHEDFVIADNVNGTHIVGGTEVLSRPIVGFYGDDGDQPVCLTNIASPVKGMDVANKHYVDGAILFDIIDGTVCDRCDKVQLSGTDGSWYQKELANPINEPYLNEWGWQCCVDDGETSMDLYRWLYRCVKEGFTVEHRTLVIDGVEQEPIAVDGGDDIALAVATAYGDTSAEAMANYFRPTYPTDSENFHVLNIPLAQFKGLSDDVLRKVIFRVKEDNAELCFLFFPMNKSEEPIIPAVGESGNYTMLYSIEPTTKKREEMVDVMRAALTFVQDKVYHLYGIEATDKLYLDQKTKVLKVIHDWIILHGWSSDVESEGVGIKINYLLSSAYAALDPKMIAFCAGYTQAFNYLARSFGIHAIYMSGSATRYDGSDAGGHTWCSVQMTDSNSPDGESYEYGTYSEDPIDWSCVDVYWDEPTHEVALGGIPDRNDVIWRYFLDVGTIFPAVGQYPNHIIDDEKGYGYLPCNVLDPEASYKYEGNALYRWGDS